MDSKIVGGDFRQLDMLVKAVSHDTVVKVGIFGTQGARTRGADRGLPGKFSPKTGLRRRTKTPAAMTNAEVGLVHELGRKVKKPLIPQRSWLRFPIEHEREAIIKEALPLVKQNLAKGNRRGALAILGDAAENAIQRAFATRGFGTWESNKPSTIRRKGSSAPLIDTAQLRRAVTSKVDRPS